jgi:hypothetical protein
MKQYQLGWSEGRGGGLTLESHKPSPPARRTVRIQLSFSWAGLTPRSPNLELSTTNVKHLLENNARCESSHVLQ